MLLNSWSIALVICSVASLFLGIAAFPTAMKVVLSYKPGDDSSKQIDLEQKTWLAALLIEYAMWLQLFSLLLLIFAADHFSGILKGAMCAAGAFTANDYGFSLLNLRICCCYIFGAWILIHKLDIRSEFASLTRLKFSVLLLILPLLILDSGLLVFYLLRLEPDIITSCCGVVFGQSSTDGMNLFGPTSKKSVLTIFYVFAIILWWWSFVKGKTVKVQKGFLRLIPLAGILFWVSFIALSLFTITTVFSSYIYAMPSHRCPFDILKSEYNFIGYPIYFSLFMATFMGIANNLCDLLIRYPGMEEVVRIFQIRGRRLVLCFLPIFLLIVSSKLITYIVFGGEIIF